MGVQREADGVAVVAVRERSAASGPGVMTTVIVDGSVTTALAGSVSLTVNERGTRPVCGSGRISTCVRTREIPGPKVSVRSTAT